MKFTSLLVMMAANVAISKPVQGKIPAPRLPQSSWNTHTHCFDPERHPFKSSRTYTPEAAPLEDLIKQSPADNVMIVQATIEDGYSGLLDTLAKGHEKYPNKQILGTIFWDPEDSSLKNKTDAEWDRLHEAGVRSVRIHGWHGGTGDDLDWVLEKFVQVATYCPLERHGWTVSVQIPLSTWSKMKGSILNHPKLKSVTIIADHNGSAGPEHYGTVELDDFLALLATGRFYSKVGAFHRRSDDISLMEPIIKAFAKTAPGRLVWGSDWPHVNTSAKRLEPSPPLEVDTDEELRLLREWLTDDQWEKMFVCNPLQVFSMGKP